MAINSELLIKNCEVYASSYKKAIDVLRKANGKEDYKFIAEELEIRKLGGVS